MGGFSICFSEHLTGHPIKQRKERIKHLADDLPKVAKAYKEFKEGRV